MFSSKMLTTILSTLLLSQTTLAAYWKGFNLGANNAKGACKSQWEWEKDMDTIKKWNQGFGAIRTFAASDCDTLARAVPAAKNKGFKILVGVWATDYNHFEAEKAALLRAIQNFGTDWIAAISVGSEDLYRKDISPQALAGQIYDVRGMVRQFNSKITVGHTDTWTAWVDPANDPVTKACDFVVMDGYPYWQGADISQAKQVFFDSLTATKNRVNAVHGGIKVWIGETGWPTVGASNGASVPSKGNAQRYWKEVACSIFGQTHVFWFSAFDAPTAQPQVEQGFGVAYSGRTLKWNLAC